MPLRSRPCEICLKAFVPRSHKTEIEGSPSSRRCPECRRAGDSPVGGSYPGVAEVHNASAGNDLTPPLVQAVFDIETFALDRGWGVMMVGSIMLHRGGSEPEVVTFDLTESPQWPNVRSDDSDLALRILTKLDEAHILFAHNGAEFDVKWLRTLALRYELPFTEKKLVDPCQIARNKYRIGNNSLSAVTDFLFPGSGLQKMPVPAEVWRRALLDNDKPSWEILRARCESDVRLLNAVAARVTRDVGMLDYRGSAYR